MREEYRNRNKYAVEMGAKYGVQAAAFLASAGYSEVASTIGYLMNSRTEDENIDIVEGRVEEAKQD